MTLLTEKEAAERLRVSPGTLRNWRSGREGRGPRYARIGGRVVYDEADLLAWVNDRKRSGTDQPPDGWHNFEEIKGDSNVQ